MKVQLSLAISGCEEEARERAAKMREHLEALGYEVVDPFSLCRNIYDGEDKYMYWWLCTKLCCHNLVTNHIDMIAYDSHDPHYRASYGCVIERIVAEKCNIKQLDFCGALYVDSNEK